ncbi:hypothetical protein TNCV_4329281 [Trichonephila clavipes]|nr:hypothetical protein TNCV_4329281 [Trichonephila clavipes]
MSPHCYYPSLACSIPRFVSNLAYLGSFGTASWASHEFERTRYKVPQVPGTSELDEPENQGSTHPEGRFLCESPLEYRTTRENLLQQIEKPISGRGIRSGVDEHGHGFFQDGAASRARALEAAGQLQQWWMRAQRILNLGTVHRTRRRYRLGPQILDYVEVRHSRNTANLLQIVDKYEEPFMHRQIRGSSEGFLSSGPNEGNRFNTRHRQENWRENGNNERYANGTTIPQSGRSTKWVEK